MLMSFLVGRFWYYIPRRPAIMAISFIPLFFDLLGESIYYIGR